MGRLLVVNNIERKISMSKTREKKLDTFKRQIAQKEKQVEKAKETLERRQEELDEIKMKEQVYLGKELKKIAKDSDVLKVLEKLDRTIVEIDDFDGSPITPEELM